MISKNPAVYSLQKSILSILFVRLFISAIALIWITGFSLPVLINDKIVEQSVFPFVKHIYSLICHQEDLKSFSINGRQLFVCSRCSGIYTGSFISSLFLLFTLKQFQLKKIFLWIAPIPMFIDVLFLRFHLYEYNKMVSMITGLFLGSILIIYISDVFEKISIKK
jgi:uncharacterized membrane protein